MFRNNFIAYLFFPPILSIVLLLKNIYKYGSKKTICFFLIFYTIFVTYVYPEYDTFLTFFDSISSSGIQSGDALTNFLGLILEKIHINFYSVFPILWFLTIILYYKSAMHIYKNQKRFPFLVFILLLFFLVLRDWVGFTYFTLASAICLFYGIRCKKTILNFVLISFLVFIIHPGVLMVFMPGHLLNFLYKRNFTKLSFAFIILYAILTFLIFNGNLIFSFNRGTIISDIYQRFVHYTEIDYIWGGGGHKMGPLGVFNKILTYLIIAFLLFLSVRNYKGLKNNYPFSLFLLGSIALFNSISLWTLSERFTVICMMNASMVLTLLYKHKYIRIKTLKTCLYAGIIVYMLPIWFHRTARDIIFKDAVSSYTVSLRTLYVPSILLITDVEDFGFSDKYLLDNAKFGHNILKWRKNYYLYN